MVATEKKEQKKNNEKTRKGKHFLARNSSNPRPTDYNTKALTTVPSICFKL